MNKLKLSVGVLAFVGLAVLNFTQSERGFISQAFASSSYSGNTGGGSTGGFWSSLWSTATSWIGSQVSSYIDNNQMACHTMSCIKEDTDKTSGSITIPIEGVPVTIGGSHESTHKENGSKSPCEPASEDDTSKALFCWLLSCNSECQ